MPSDFLYIDTNLPSFTDRSTTEEKVAAIQNYLYMLLEQLRYTLNNLGSDNFNSAALDALKKSIAEKVETNTVISNTVITNNLYSEFGDIAELTVDRLLTANKVERYNNSDSSDINYIWVQDQSIKIMTASVDYDTDGMTPLTIQHTDRDGNLLYYNKAATASTYKEVGMTTTATAYPVTVYKYTEQEKAKFCHKPVTISGATVYVPALKMGAGSGTGNNDTVELYKMPDAFYMVYTDDSGEAVSMEFSSGSIKVTGNTGTGLSLRNVAISSTAPSSPQYGDMWINTGS